MENELSNIEFAKQSSAKLKLIEKMIEHYIQEFDVKKLLLEYEIDKKLSGVVVYEYPILNI